MKLESVQTKNKKRPGRGISSGQGKTAGRGTKGQKSRSGFNIPKRHEGGQTPLSMRLPKLPGFKSFKKKATIVSLDHISAMFKDGDVVSVEALENKGLIKKGEKAKILNNGKLTVKVSLGKDVKVSENIVKLFVENVPAVKEDKALKAKKDAAPVEKAVKEAVKKPAAKKTAK
ncbi:MAG: 50S ribosomal protein L15 [Patescibacteria group bacterium]